MANKKLLPLDILYAVAEILAARSDMDSLKTSSLACRDFRRICEKHIFAKVDLTADDGSLVDQFKKLLDIKPEAAAFVQDVRLFLDPPYSSNLLTVLSSMKAIRRLSLRIRKPSVAWTAMPPVVRSSIQNTIRTPTLTHLEIRALDNFPIAKVITPPLSLTSLVLFAVSPQRLDPLNGGFSSTSVSYPSIQLRSLTVLHVSMDACFALLSNKQLDGSPSVNLSLLEFLDIYMESKEGVLRLLLEDYEGLKSLTIRLHMDWDLRGTLSAMKPCTKENLQSLSLELDDVTGQDRDPFLGLCDELKSFPSASALKKIEVKIFVMSDCDCSTRLEYWNAFDEVLQGGNFRFLEEVSLSVNINRYWSDDKTLEAKLQSIAKSAFRRLEQAADVRFQCIIATDLE